jgi:hypothetical protein
MCRFTITVLLSPRRGRGFLTRKGWVVRKFRGTARCCWVFVLALCAALFVPTVAHATPTFLSPLTISPPARDAFEPQVVVDSSDRVIAVWTGSDGVDLRIQTATRTASGPWSAVQSISASGRSASSPQIALDPAGNAVAVWIRFDGASSKVQAAYRPAGGSFGSGVNVSSGGDSSAPDVSMDNAGNATIVWQRWDGSFLRVQATVRSPGAAGVVGPVSTLSVTGQDAFDPKAASGPSADANAALVWTRTDGTNLRVQASRRRDRVGYPRPRGATPTRAALVVAYDQCVGSGNRSHGPPFAVPSCNPPAQGSSVLQVGTTDANGFSANFVGSVRFITVTGNTSTEADEADVKLIVSLTDIRNKPSGTDYVGRVLPTVPLQITDNLNSPENPEPGTTEWLDFRFPVDCTSTADASIGATCAVDTTADAILPGTVIETKRTIWQLGQVTVKDAGPNGTGYQSCPPTCGDGDESTFLREGVFVP